MPHFIRTAAACALLLLSTLAHAVPVSFTLAGTASGTLNGTTFTGVQFSITGASDSTLLTPWSADTDLLPLLALDIDMAGLGHVEAINKTYFFVNRSASLAGFLDQLDGDFIDLTAPRFGTYDGVTSLLPLPVGLDYAGILNTSAGALALTDMTAALEVSGIDAAVPEPGSVALLAAGWAACAATRRTRRPPARHAR